MSTDSSNTKKKKEKSEMEMEKNRVSPADAKGYAEAEGEKSSSPILRSMNRIRNITSALSTFILKWDELETHLDFVCNAIDEVSKKQNEITHQSDDPHRFYPAADVSFTPAIPTSELGCLAQSMDARGFRKHVSTHLSDKPELRRELAQALACAPDPRSLVLECMREVCRHGGVAQTKMPHLAFVQRACILILEAFIESRLYAKRYKQHQDAQSVATIWKERLIKEGGSAGLAKAQPGDALALLLFLSAFGLPAELIGADEFYSLICASGVSNETQLLIGSSKFFREKFSDVVKWLQNDRKHIEAVDLVYAFGNESMIQPLSILQEFLNSMRIFLRDFRRDGQNTPTIQNDANEKQLAVLKAVIRCLKDHNLESAASDWNLNEMVAKLKGSLGKRKFTAVDLADHGIAENKPNGEVAKVKTQDMVNTLERRNQPSSAEIVAHEKVQHPKEMHQPPVNPALATIPHGRFNQPVADPARVWHQEPSSAFMCANIGAPSSIGQVANQIPPMLGHRMPPQEQHPRPSTGMANPALSHAHFNQVAADSARGWYQGPPRAPSGPTLGPSSSVSQVGHASTMLNYGAGAVPGMPPAEQQPLPPTTSMTNPAGAMLPNGHFDQAAANPARGLHQGQPPAMMETGVGHVGMHLPAMLNGAAAGPAMHPAQQHPLPPTTPTINPAAAPLPPGHFNQAVSNLAGGLYQGLLPAPMGAATLGALSAPVGHIGGAIGPGLNLVEQSQLGGQPLGPGQGLPQQPLPPYPMGPMSMPNAAPWQNIPDPNRFV